MENFVGDGMLYLLVVERHRSVDSIISSEFMNLWWGTKNETCDCRMDYNQFIIRRRTLKLMRYHSKLADDIDDELIGRFSIIFSLMTLFSVLLEIA